MVVVEIVENIINKRVNVFKHKQSFKESFNKADDGFRIFYKI